MAGRGDPRERARNIRWLLLDVDGILTDGHIEYASDGTETKRFHVRDGSGLKIWQSLGRGVAILSGRNSPVVTRRAAELGITHVMQGQKDKLPVFAQWLQEHQIAPEEVCAMGDDLPDLAVLSCCGLAATVADACVEVQTICDYVSLKKGGDGAVRDVVEWLLNNAGEWPSVVAAYGPEVN
jgi:3-deoxy-D-manno-octulosonate 8-phosphate phosphatase (KDO 8-P phosphatase)